MAQFRLDKFLADRTPHSRAEVKKLLRAGAVLVDGKAVSDPACKIDTETQEVRCQGKIIRSAEHTYILLNKPEGVVSATEDRDHKTVIDLVPPELRVKGLFPAGRLDADSTGLLLLTDDGDLAHRMLSPKHHVPKYYLVQPRTAPLTEVRRTIRGRSDALRRDGMPPRPDRTAGSAGTFRARLPARGEIPSGQTDACRSRQSRPAPAPRRRRRTHFAAGSASWGLFGTISQGY